MDDDIKLPEPVAYMGTFQIAGCKPGVLAHHTHTNLETLRVSGPQGQSVQPLFTADQLRAAVEADRVQRETAAEAVCYEAYQVVGSLLSDLGVFETEAARKILDNLSQGKLVHDDVLPWASFELPARKPLTRADYENKSDYLGCTSAAMRHGFEAGVRFAERMHGIREKP